MPYQPVNKLPHQERAKSARSNQIVRLIRSTKRSDREKGILACCNLNLGSAEINTFINKEDVFRLLIETFKQDEIILSVNVLQAILSLLGQSDSDSMARFMALFGHFKTLFYTIVTDFEENFEEVLLILDKFMSIFIYLLDIADDPIDLNVENVTIIDALEKIFESYTQIETELVLTNHIRLCTRLARMEATFFDASEAFVNAILELDEPVEMVSAATVFGIQLGVWDREAILHRLSTFFKGLDESMASIEAMINEIKTGDDENIAKLTYSTISVIDGVTEVLDKLHEFVVETEDKELWSVLCEEYGTCLLELSTMFFDIDDGCSVLISSELNRAAIQLIEFDGTTVFDFDIVHQEVIDGFFMATLQRIMKESAPFALIDEFVRVSQGYEGLRFDNSELLAILESQRRISDSYRSAMLLVIECGNIEDLKNIYKEFIERNKENETVAQDDVVELIRNCQAAILEEGRSIFGENCFEAGFIRDKSEEEEEEEEEFAAMFEILKILSADCEGVILQSLTEE
ncbi:hypothetical protein PCE1_004377 [Barthelona sp. PCE]